MRGFVDNKGVIWLLSIDLVIIEVRNQRMQKGDEFLDVVRDLLCSAMQNIEKFENISSDLSCGHVEFRQLLDYCNNLGNDYTKKCDIGQS